MNSTQELNGIEQTLFQPAQVARNANCRMVNFMSTEVRASQVRGVMVVILTLVTTAFVVLGMTDAYLAKDWKQAGIVLLMLFTVLLLWASLIIELQIR